MLSPPAGAERVPPVARASAGTSRNSSRSATTADGLPYGTTRSGTSNRVGAPPSAST
jgi:hypothetical protein